MKNNKRKTPYRWFILILGSLTNAVVVAIPAMSLSVFLPVISKELDLTLLQSGLVWGISSLPLIISSTLSGILDDRFGTKRILMVACLFTGTSITLRGFANQFQSLLAVVFLSGFFAPMVSISNIKNTSIWFSDRERGLANGVLTLGMALGFFFGSMFSSTLVSPIMGGWRNAYIFYGLISTAFVIPWALSRSTPEGTELNYEKLSKEIIAERFLSITKKKKIWLIGLSIMLVSGGVQGFIGYLPLYLRGIGWEEVSSDGALASFHLASMLGVIPLTIISDKLSIRKPLIMVGSLMSAFGIGSLFLLKNKLIWGAVILAGLTRDTVMAILFTMIAETEGLKRQQTGIAIGFVMIFLGLGNLVSPPLGNKFAEIANNVPFIFWSILCLLGFITISWIRERHASTMSPDNN